MRGRLARAQRSIGRVLYRDCNFNNRSEGQDCATMDGMGDWYDDQCSLTQGYVCETP